MYARSEFLKAVGTKDVKCAIIVDMSEYDNHKFIILKVGYSADDYEDFLNKLNFDYDCGYGAQYLDGTIWYTDSTWSERFEYDGSEWWEYKQTPQIPKECE